MHNKMNTFISLASSYIYKSTEKNTKQGSIKEESVSTNTNTKQLEKVKPELIFFKKPFNNFTIIQKKLLMSDSIRKAEEFAKKQSECYCYKHCNLLIKPSWCYKCNKNCNNTNNLLYPILALNGTLNNIDFAILGLIGVGCISYIFYWKR